jgi:sec-independent protein translocase protein TatA
VIGDVLQPTHLIFILIVALIVLGPKRLPEVGRALGRGIRDFKYALSTDVNEEDPAAGRALDPIHAADDPIHAADDPIHAANEPTQPAEAAVATRAPEQAPTGHSPGAS